MDLKTRQNAIAGEHECSEWWGLGAIKPVRNNMHSLRYVWACAIDGKIDARASAFAFRNDGRGIQMFQIPLGIGVAVLDHPPNQAPLVISQWSGQLLSHFLRPNDSSDATASLVRVAKAKARFKGRWHPSLLAFAPPLGSRILLLIKQADTPTY